MAGEPSGIGSFVYQTHLLLVLLQLLLPLLALALGVFVLLPHLHVVQVQLVELGLLGLDVLSQFVLLPGKGQPVSSSTYKKSVRRNFCIQHMLIDYHCVALAVRKVYFSATGNATAPLHLTLPNVG